MKWIIILTASFILAGCHNPYKQEMRNMEKGVFEQAKKEIKNNENLSEREKETKLREIRIYEAEANK